MQNSDIKFVFFGTPEIAATILDELKMKELTPSLIVTAPDRPAGRGMKLTSPPVKVWADENRIPTLQPEKLDEDFIAKLKEDKWDLFVVFAFSSILKKEVIEIPIHGTINLHPSLLPKLRGPSPIVSAILTDAKTTGVTVIQIDEKMDHGSILAQEEITPETWPLPVTELEETLMKIGGELLADTIPKIISKDVEPREQDHSDATFCHMLKKEDGLIDLNDDPYQSLLKIKAYAGWPGTYFYVKKNGKEIRVKITEARLSSDKRLLIERVVPEGKKEMSYVDFLKS